MHADCICSTAKQFCKEMYLDVEYVLYYFGANVNSMGIIHK